MADKPTHCPGMAELLAFDEGRLPEPSVQEIAEHLEECARCSAFLEDIERRSGRRAWLPGNAREPLLREPECAELEAKAGAIRASEVSRGAAPGWPAYMEGAGFSLRATVGEGPHGTVYCCGRRGSRDRFALKVVPAVLAGTKERLTRYLKASQLAARLSDDRLVPDTTYFSDGRTLVLVRPFVEGTDLARLVNQQRLRRQGKHAAAEALTDADYLTLVLRALGQVVATVALLHRRKAAHGGLTPANCRIDSAQEARLTDFGFAQLAGPWRSPPITTEIPALGSDAWDGDTPEFVPGTPGFLSPEEWLGTPGPDLAIDVFRLGVTIYQALTLELPFGTAPIGVRRPLPAPPSRRQDLLSSALDPIILGALSPDRKDRYPSAAELWDDWQRVQTASACRR